jgi:hypothetical protein
MELPGVGIELDVHRELFGPLRFRLPAAQVLSRGRADDGLYGVPVLVPNPLDACAHAVGHAAAAHEPETTDRAREDVRRLMERFALDPTAVARHLDACGLGRAARFVLGREIVSRLKTDGLGDAMARLIPRLAPDPLSLRARLFGHFTNASLALAARAAGRALWERARRRLAHDSV